MKRAVVLIVLGALAIFGSAGLIVAAPLPAAVSALAFHASLVDQGPSPTLLPGATTTYSVRFRNVGLAPWQRGGRSQVTLGVSGDAVKFADLGMAAGWLSPNRIATPSEDLVLPGTIGTFTFSVRAPQTAGVYTVPLRLVAEGITWLEDNLVSLVVTSDIGYHSALVDQSRHPTLHPGETSGPLTIHVRNTGARTWKKGTLGQQVNLGIVGDDKTLSSVGVGWPSADRVAMQAEPAVAPGGVGTFTFRVRAPNTPGTYPLRLRPVVDGLMWLEDDDLVSIITVVPAGVSTSAPLTAATQVDPKLALGQPQFALTATVSPITVVAGTAAQIEATFTSSIASKDVLGVEVRGPGNATLAYQRWFHAEVFAAGEKKAYPMTWLVPFDAVLGTYTVSLTAYSDGWKTLFGANVSAATFGVTQAAAQSSPTPPPTGTNPPGATVTPPASTTQPAVTPSPTAAVTPAPSASPSFTTTASLSAASVTAGGSIGVTAAVTAATAATALVDIEIWGPADTTPTYQVWFDGQAFAAGQQQTYPAQWQVPSGTALGTYVVKLAVYSAGWAQLYSSNNSAASFQVAAPSPTPSPTPPPPSPTTAPLPTPIAAPGELLSNRGFESGAASWNLNPQAGIDTSTAGAHTGTNSLKLVATAPWQGTSQVVPVVAGQTYTVSGWARSTSAGAYLTLISFDINNLDLGSHTDLVFAGTGSWTSLSRTYVAPAGTVNVWVGAQSSGAGTFWFDDVSLVSSGAPAPTTTPAPTATPGPTSTPLPTAAPGSVSPVHVQGNHIVNALGQQVVIHGVNRAGTEYACIQGWGMFDGAHDLASVLAIRSWRTNAVRVPLNEDCWLSINGAAAAYSGAIYQQAVKDYVNLLTQNGLYAIVDLHWSGPGTVQATQQQPMPDTDHSIAFWTQVATAFKGNGAVILEPFNEPWPDSNRNTTAAWTCWRDGGTCAGVAYQVAGMQTLVNTIRGTGAANVIALGGVQYSNTLSQWLTYKPSDPLNNLVAAWHIYNFQGCSNSSCYDSQAAPVAAQVPLLATEVGTDTCDAAYFNTLLNWLDAHQSGYLAWTWNTWGAACGAIALVSDLTGTPTTYGQLYKTHLANLP